MNDSKLKPSALIQAGHIIMVKKDGFHLSFKVVDIIERRVSAVLAQPCYENITPEDELNKFKSWYIGKARSEFREKGAGRPTKRERREIEDYKEELYLDDWFE